MARPHIEEWASRLGTSPFYPRAYEPDASGGFFRVVFDCDGITFQTSDFPLGEAQELPPTISVEGSSTAVESVADIGRALDEKRERDRQRERVLKEQDNRDRAAAELRKWEWKN